MSVAVHHLLSVTHTADAICIGQRQDHAAPLDALRVGAGDHRVVRRAAEGEEGLVRGEHGVDVGSNSSGAGHAFTEEVDAVEGHSRHVTGRLGEHKLHTFILKCDRRGRLGRSESRSCAANKGQGGQGPASEDHLGRGLVPCLSRLLATAL